MKDFEITSVALLSVCTRPYSDAFKVGGSTRNKN